MAEFEYRCPKCGSHVDFHDTVSETEYTAAPQKWWRCEDEKCGALVRTVEREFVLEVK